MSIVKAQTIISKLTYYNMPVPLNATGYPTCNNTKKNTKYWQALAQ